MPSPDSITILNRVLVILERSFPQYLRYARPYVPMGRENVMRTVDEIVAGQDALAERVSQQIFDAAGLPDHGDFPIEFTDTHDLDIDFLIVEAIRLTEDDIKELEQCVEALRLAPAAQSLASEALGTTKAHLALLKELPINPAASTVIREKAPAFANDMPVSNEQTGTPHRQEEEKRLAGKTDRTGTG
jgi:hypothetical protein